MDSLALYVHVPFCAKKCSYCDFNAYSGLGSLAGGYVDAVTREIRGCGERGRRVSTVFFGGGTPTYLTGEQLAAILGTIRQVFAVDSDAEITSEANPTSADAARFQAMTHAGFNRVSVGVQAFDDRLLRLVDREHSAEEAVDAVRAARNAGFVNLNLDLMFALPTQTLEDWDATLDQALSLEPEHISAYALTLEPGTRFERLHAGGNITLPDENLEIAMYERTIERLTANGFDHYEISNFARPGFRSRHNLVYWLNDEYLGFGPGAVSYLRGRRWTTEKNPGRYIAWVRDGASPRGESEKLDQDGSLAETLIQGLRLREGVALARIRNRFETDSVERYSTVFATLRDQGLLEYDAERLRLTHRGLLLANEVSMALLP